MAEHLSRLQASFKRTLTTELKAFKAEAAAFRCAGVAYRAYAGIFYWHLKR